MPPHAQTPNNGFEGDDTMFVIEKNVLKAYTAEPGISSITIPEGVTRIGKGAFCRCFTLRSIALSESILEIGESAFAECINLSSVILSESLKRIGACAFENCTDLSNILLPNSLICIGDYSFRGSGLKKITIPESVEKIGASAFRCCYNLSEIVVLGKNTAIDAYAFRGPSEVSCLRKAPPIVYCKSGSMAEKHCRDNHLTYCIIERYQKMECASYAIFRAIRPMWDSMVDTLAEDIANFMDAECTEDGVLALCISDDEQREYFQKHFMEEFEKNIQAAFDGALHLELVDQETLIAYRQAKKQPLKKRTVHICSIRSVQQRLADIDKDFILCSCDTIFEQKDNILQLQFANTTDHTDPNVFTIAQADLVAKFLKRSDANNELYICSDSGVSRSPAIAAAVFRAMGKNDYVIWRNTRYIPNHYVFRLMCVALHADIPEDALWNRVRVNASVRESNESHK